MRTRLLLLLPFLLACLCHSGCALSRPASGPIPVAFQARPTMPQVIESINANSERVQQLHSSNVRLSIPGQFGALTATMDYERSPNPVGPGRFRLSGEVLGTRHLDLGSNDLEYWMWVKQNPPTVFWGQHARFHESAARQILPMPPSWIVEALGLVTLDPNGLHDGPYQSQQGTPGLFQIRTTIPTPRGDLTRVLEIDERRALIVQQLVYDSSKRLLAVADTSDFVHDPLAGVTLPRRIQIQLPPSGQAFNFEVDNYVINESPTNPQLLWAMPQLPGHQYRDLSNPADMQGINLLGGAGADPYDTQNVVRQPQRPDIPRSAWRGLPPLSFLR